MAGLITVDLSDFKKLRRDLEKAKKSLPYTARKVLNNAAFILRSEWQSEVRNAFTLRNSYTVGSIRVEKATGTDLSSMQSKTGSVADYMERAEEGETVTGPVPAPAAAGNAPGSNKRTRLTRRAFQFGGIQVGAKGPKLGKRRQNAIALAIAMRKGERFVLLNRTTAKGKGIFEVRGVKRGKVNMRLIWSVKKGSMRVEATPTMARANKRARPHIERAIAAEWFKQGISRLFR